MKRIRLTELSAKPASAVRGGLAMLQPTAFELTGPYASASTLITGKEIALKNTSVFN